MTIISLENAHVGSVKMTFDLEAQGHVALCGMEESLSSVLLDTLLGFNSVHSGEYFFTGKATADLSIRKFRQLRSMVGVVSEHYGLVANLKVWENVLLPVEFHSDISSKGHQHALVTEALRLSQYEGDPFASIDSLSRFERKQVLLARAYVLSPALNIYDRFLEGHTQSEKQLLLHSAYNYSMQNKSGASLYLVDEKHDFTALDYVQVLAANDEGDYVY